MNAGAIYRQQEGFFNKRPMAKLWGAIRLGVCVLTLVSCTTNIQAQEVFELRGKIVGQDGKPLSRVPPAVYLHGSLTPFQAGTRANLDGGFKFKKLLAGTYTIVVDAFKLGSMRQTVVVSSSLSDKNGRIEHTLVFKNQQTGQTDSAVSIAQLRISTDARRAYRQAQRELEKRDVNSAIEHLKRALDISPQFAHAWNLLGTIAYQSKDYAAAERHFRQALEQDPQDYLPLVNLGGVLLSLKRPQEALPINSKAAARKPLDPLAHAQLGQNYYQLGLVEKAQFHLEKAKHLDPRHFSMPQLFLAEIHLLRRDWANARKELHQVLSLHPDFPNAAFVKDWLQRVSEKEKMESDPP